MEIIRENEIVDCNIEVERLKDRNILLFGYFQSYKYFENQYETIIRLLSIQTLKTNLAIKLNFNFNKTNKINISMHFRLGDYKKIQDYHPIMSYKYYEDSLQYVLDNMEPISDTDTIEVIYFCEEEDINDVNEKIERLKVKFPVVTFTRASNDLSDWEQMLYMSLCDHNIIANSSFSWWGAYFNSNDRKMVCYPSLWYGQKVSVDTTHMYPLSWIKIDVHE